jgi:hypothetical protein
MTQALQVLVFETSVVWTKNCESGWAMTPQTSPLSSRDLLIDSPTIL